MDKKVQFLTSTAVGHHYIPEPYNHSTINIQAQIPIITRYSQIERWWNGGAVIGPSEYGAQYTTSASAPPRDYIGESLRLNPAVLRPATMEHFFNAGYSRRARSYAKSIFPGRNEPWKTIHDRAISVSKNDQLPIWDSNMYPKSWGFGRQDTWISPRKMERYSPLRDTVTFFSHRPHTSLPTYTITKTNRGMQSEFQAAYQGIPSKHPNTINYSSADVISKLAPHEALLAPDMYTPESNMYGSGRPTTAWV